LETKQAYILSPIKRPPIRENSSIGGLNPGASISPNIMCAR